MRLGVIDVGSNTVHLLVVDAHRGAQPLPAYSHKIELRLSEHTTDDGSIAEGGVKRLSTFVGECLTVAEDQGIEDLLAFATSAIREAPNGDEVLQQVREETGADLQVLSGADEARLTFLAVRRWFGWSSGRLLCLDVGGGSLEIAAGLDEEPDAALSLPLGAGRLTRELPGDPPDLDDVRALRKRVRSDIGRVVRDVTRLGAADRVVGTSKTVRSLARITGAAPSEEGPYVARSLQRSELTDLIPRLAQMRSSKRADLPGVSIGRAPQLLAGALVIEGAMDLLGAERLDVCPWALREGVILRRLDWLGQDS
ncbi:Ppx/GppA phosphatase family protein [Luteipulveratus sp. YIM 133132]|uniref:Ppx/GppA phosphatase family protein n=1 Tax=Luteipulveratus flavus TaxID=3031728 RepID=A0ABT6C8P5_9MICO|nr:MULTISPECIES: Ppx/GppA phosphatase family protein [unclassified Luteipulveratus]MDE9364988.1 Ppx/GppA phosphatase family protein [Luteipulveratus sp. YIM 133132]MDF8264672.1 Ppx/GppA phosphatase family protein [Luteipulveratus sp. YIM 133296]